LEGFRSNYEESPKVLEHPNHHHFHLSVHPLPKAL
jgi:hypothetical protein